MCTPWTEKDAIQKTQKSASKWGVPSTGSPLKFHGLLISCSLSKLSLQENWEDSFLSKRACLTRTLENYKLVILSKPVPPHHYCASS